MTTARKARIAKIKALLSKTVGNGCTEAEAMSALEMSQRLKAQFEIGDDDLTFGGEEVQRDTRVVSDRDKIRSSLLMSVGRFCDCCAWTCGIDTLSFCGLESDVGFAHWLLDMLADFVSRELAAYLERTWKPGTPRVRRVESDGFVAGCTSRICQRLDELAPKPKVGTGIVVAKNALILAKMTELGIELHQGRRRHGSVDAKSHNAGLAAGARAQFNRPVNDGQPVLRLVSSRSPT